MRQNGYNEFFDLTWEKASDVSSSIYSINIPSEDDGIPLSVKRTAVDAVNLRKRLSEEEQLLVNEMDNCVKAFYSSCMEREEKINSLRSTHDLGDNDISRGLCSLEKSDLHEDRINLHVACHLFRVFTTIPEEIVSYVEQHFQRTFEILEIDSEDDVDDEQGFQSEENVI